ncbi:beta-1,4-glucuronyltransferase 1-like [Diorhabda sublineata]|uniref:beta-1,4-glucuronyltransferase 1-like n=1 Tax=Diorhabda sublineata TaxID=1163346 RepID=UPI0024E0BE42|nr:beta-1,4-glucuronyltransferase 1-like [Diorhabda sublineata]XP_056640355.1 beta-1,4-glucuronyltransferase 1-like [Diorhabda sublineata]XP_056640356.1 beta-1,4-glucuronyltransferase 1-like [Diorhabda sublineata]
MIYPKVTPMKCLLTVILTSLTLAVFILSSNELSPSLLIVSRIFNPEIRVNYTPGDFVKYMYLEPANESYCNFNYKLLNDFTFDGEYIDYGPELGKNSPYRVIYNVISAKATTDIPKVTYATHVSADFMYYLPELVRYWDGFISVTAFVPDTDVALVLKQINQYCHCLPGMSRVSLHFAYSVTTVPLLRNIYFNKPVTCEVADSSKIETYRHTNDSVIYPINVCRNAARTASLTENVMVSDIQLMPSEGLARKFLDMIDQYKLYDCSRNVYVLPIFEVEANEEIPRRKSQLVELLRENKAVYFHKLICTHCQKFPGIETWLRTTPSDIVEPLVSARREVPYHRWEPIYIGTKAEPFYNEMLSWEGLQDKMLQMLEMCLMEYKFVILDGAFLVHWPGIKKKQNQQNEEQWREPFKKQNSNEYAKILMNLLSRYDAKSECKPY